MAQRDSSYVVDVIAYGKKLATGILVNITNMTKTERKKIYTKVLGRIVNKIKIE